MSENQKESLHDSDIRELRKLVINNLNSIHSLEASFKNVEKVLLKKGVSSEETKSFVLVVMLGIVIVIAFFFYFRAESARYQDKISILTKQEKFIKTELTEIKERMSEMENNDIKAFNLYITLKEGEPDKAMKMYEDFNLSALSRLERLLIDTEMNVIKLKAALKKFSDGKNLFKIKSYEAAVSKFDDSLKISQTGDHIPELFYFTAISQYRQRQFDKAAITFDRFLFVNREKGLTKDKAELLLGVCYEKMKQYDRALNFYHQVLRDNRLSSFRPTIIDRIKIMEKKLMKERTMEGLKND